MRVALLLTGFIRSHEQNFNSIKNLILDNYDTDVYISTWDKDQSYINSELKESSPENIIKLYERHLKGFSILNFSSYLNEKKKIQFIDREYDVFKTNQRAIDHGSLWIERLRDQWYLVNKGFKLISTEYDKVMRLRFDINLHSFRIIEESFVIPQPHPLNPYSDHMAYGNMEEMAKYCNMYNNIQIIYKEHNIDISFAENMLKFYMESTSPIVNTYIDSTIQYEIIK